MTEDINKARKMTPSIYTVSFKDLVDAWIELMHPLDHVLVVWDAKNHIELLKKSGFGLNTPVLYDNKVLTIIFDDVRDCFYVMDVLSAHEEGPYIQVYSEGKLLTDNLENLREEITN